MARPPSSTVSLVPEALAQANLSLLPSNLHRGYGGPPMPGADTVPCGNQGHREFLLTRSNTQNCLREQDKNMNRER